MDHVIKIFVGDSGEGLGDSTYYRSSLSGSDIERCHKTACQAIGIAWWGDLLCDSFRLTREEGEALKKVPALAELIEEDKRGFASVDIAWSDVYLEVARHGAILLGLDLQFEEIEADYIDAGGEIHGARAVG